MAGTRAPECKHQNARVAVGLSRSTPRIRNIATNHDPYDDHRAKPCWVSGQELLDTHVPSRRWSAVPLLLDGWRYAPMRTNAKMIVVEATSIAFGSNMFEWYYEPTTGERFFSNVLVQKCFFAGELVNIQLLRTLYLRWFFFVSAQQNFVSLICDLRHFFDSFSEILVKKLTCFLTRICLFTLMFVSVVLIQLFFMVLLVSCQAMLLREL